MKIFPISSESLGTRSSCHLITTEDVTILIDPSVSLGPRRYGLPPHPLELAISKHTRDVILDLVEQTDILITTHYHGDHYTLGVKRIVEFTDNEVANRTYGPKKRVPYQLHFAKSPNDTNFNQKKRAYYLWRRKDINIKPADGTKLKIGDTLLEFSPSYPHGSEHSKLGTVIGIYIEDSSDSWLYTGDVDGPGNAKAVEFILSHEADFLLIDGPPFYHPQVSKQEIEISFENLKKIVKNTDSKILLEHHFLRALNWKEKMQEFELNIDPLNFAQYIGIEALFLEANRKNLMKEQPPPKNYMQALQNNDPEILAYLDDVFENNTALQELKRYLKKIKQKSFNITEKERLNIEWIKIEEEPVI